jgi:type I restriction enzyme S subunit
MTELPPGWERVRLDQVAEVKLGRQRSPKNHAGTRMRPYLRAANVTWSGVDLSDVKEMNFTEDESKVFELRGGDLLLAEASGSASGVGKPAMWRGEIASCCFQNTLLRVRSNGPLPAYLLYLLQNEAVSGRFGDAARGVGIYHLGAARLSSWQTPIPPLAEQSRIVAAIEEQFSRIDAAERSLDEARRRLTTLRTATLAHSVVGYESVELGALVAELRYGTSIKCSHEAEGRPVVRIPNVQGGIIDLSDLKFANDPEVDLSSFTLEDGDVLFVRTNGSRDLIGRVASVHGAEGMAFASYLIRARPDRALLEPRFAVIALSSPSSRALIEARAATTAGQYNLNLTALRSLPVPLPSITEQRSIIADVEQRLSIVDVLRAKIDAALRRSRALRRSILERAFTGKLVAHDRTDEPASAPVGRIARDHDAQSGRSRPARKVPA